MRQGRAPQAKRIFARQVSEPIVLSLLILSLIAPSSLQAQTSDVPQAPSALSEKELKKEEKKTRKDLKKLQDSGAAILPFETETPEEKLRREEEAKKRLESFKAEVEKKRSAELAAPSGPSEASLQTSAGSENIAQEGEEALALKKEQERAKRLQAAKAELLEKLAAKKQDPGKAKREAKLAKEKAKQERERLAREMKASEEKAKRERDEERRKAKEEERRLKREAKERQRAEKQKLEEEKRLRKVREREEKALAKQKAEALKRAKELEAARLKETREITTLKQDLALPADDLAPEERRKIVNFHLKRAQDATASGRYSDARFSLEQVLRMEPENAVARSLMSDAIQGEVATEKLREQDEKVIAQMIEEDKMREEFLSMMERLNREIRQAASEGNQLYAKNDYAAANDKFKRVMALEAEKQTIASGLVKRLKERQEKGFERLGPEATGARIQVLLGEARELEQDEEWDKAAAKYEAVFLLDPLNREASEGTDRLKKRFLATKRAEAKEKRRTFEEDFAERAQGYVTSASQAELDGKKEEAILLAKKALLLEPNNKKALRILEKLSNERGEEG